MEMPSFFRVVAYRVGDHVLTLDEIENGVLRRNAPHPATKARLDQVEEAEADLPIDELVTGAITAAEVEEFTFPLAKQKAPQPAG